MAIMIFDMDGTLINLFPMHIKAYQEMIEETYRTKLKKEKIIPHFGKPIKSCVKGMIEENTRHKLSDLELEKAIGAYIKKLTSLLKNGNVKLLPGVKQLLALLKKNNHTIILMTGGNKNVGEKAITLAGLSNFFSEKFYGDGFTKREHLLRHTMSVAKKKYGGGEKGTVVFGDTGIDIEAGKLCNTFTVAVATGFISYNKLLLKKPDLIFNDFSNYRNVYKRVKELLENPG